MSSQDEEKCETTSPQQSNKDWVQNIYVGIVLGILVLGGIAAVFFLTFCVGWTLVKAGGLPFTLFLSVICCEFFSSMISYISLLHNRKEEWDDDIVRNALCIGIFYFVLLLLELGLSVYLMYLLFNTEFEIEWIGTVGILMIFVLEILLLLVHIFCHIPKVYFQSKRAIFF